MIIGAGLGVDIVAGEVSQHGPAFGVAGQRPIDPQVFFKGVGEAS
jgi:hypothetical protein